MKITHRKIVEVHNVLEGLGKKIFAPKLAFQVIRAKQALAPEIEAIVEAQKLLALTPEIEAYNAEQKALDQNDPEFREKSMAIYEKNKDLVDGYRQKEAEFNKMLDEEIELEIPGIELNLLPEDALTVSDIETLMSILVD